MAQVQQTRNPKWRIILSSDINFIIHFLLNDNSSTVRSEFHIQSADVYASDWNLNTWIHGNVQTSQRIYWHKLYIVLLILIGELMKMRVILMLHLNLNRARFSLSLSLLLYMKLNIHSILWWLYAKGDNKFYYYTHAIFIGLSPVSDEITIGSFRSIHHFAVSFFMGDAQVWLSVVS